MGMTHAPEPLPWRVEVEIDELVLDGFGQVDRDAVTAAFRRELGRLLRRDPGRLASAGDGGDAAQARVSADLPGTMPPHRLGQSLAGAVFRAIDNVARAGDARDPEGATAAAVSRRDASPPAAPR